jgi:hypothetical protein
VVAPGQGARWIVTGLRLFLAAPIGFLILSFAYFMIVLLLAALPAIGAPLSLILYPAFTVGFMVASRAATLRQAVELPMLVAGFRERAGGQIALGGVYIAGVALAFLGAAAVGDASLLGMFAGAADAKEGAAVLSLSRSGMFVVLVLYLPMFMMMFFAPVLVAWHALAPAKALFYSFAACLLNWRAMLVYLVCGMAAMFLTANLIGALVLALASAKTRTEPALLLPMIAMTTFVLVWPILIASVFACYRDVFAAPPQEA